MLDMRLLKNFVLLTIVTVLLIGCNTDNEVYITGKPKIVLDSESGVYTVKEGAELTISPDFQHCTDNTSIVWTMDGKVVCTDVEWTSVWPEIGTFYATIEARNDAGSTTEEICIEVVELTPPIISLPLASDRVTVKAGTNYEIVPQVQHSDMDGFSMSWYLGGKKVAEGMTYTFCQSEIGTYQLKIVAENSDGSDERTVEIEVVSEYPYNAYFLPVSRLQESTTRYTFVGRPVCLRPHTEYFVAPTYQWLIDGEESEGSDEMLVFTPQKPGTYRVEVYVSENESVVSTEVEVVCVEETEEGRRRYASAGNSMYSNKVYEYLPAPGQFINETQTGGMTGAETTMEAAVAWAEKRINEHKIVSLGAFGGYIVVGFDHSVSSGSGEYDFAIEGNVFDGSNEPGVVWVMQDVNGNGKPDDEWYQLRGSEYDEPSTSQNYAVTYFRPSGARMAVQWIDSEGNYGTIDYCPDFHTQDFYYPLWIEAQSYTLYGTCLAARNSIDTSTGNWVNAPYAWGYADNKGSDNLGGDSTGSGQSIGFKISNAVMANGKPAELRYIDFVKVQTGVQAKSGALGELSTEVLGFRDLSMD